MSVCVFFSVILQTNLVWIEKWLRSSLLRPVRSSIAVEIPPWKWVFHPFVTVFTFFVCLVEKKIEKRKENLKIKSMFVLLERGLKSLNMHLIFRLMLVLKFLNIKVHRFLLELLCQAVLLQVKACVCVLFFIFYFF